MTGKRFTALTGFAALALAACAPPPRPFQHTIPPELARPQDDGPPEVAIAIPDGIPARFGQSLAGAIAIELQSYGLVAAVAPAPAPRLLTGSAVKHDIGGGVEIEITWAIADGSKAGKSAVSRTHARARDYEAADDVLVSRIALQAAPRIATLLGRPPAFVPRSPGQVAAGLSVPEVAAAPAGPGQPGGAIFQPPPRQPRLKVMVAGASGAPSDGNRQLRSGMRRALGSSNIVVIDKPGADTFVVQATAVLTPVDERTVNLEIRWELKDPEGKLVGKIEQANPVPIAATRGSWAGFGDIVASAAVEGILELLERVTKLREKSVGR